jgi:hypothetical protein
MRRDTARLRGATRQAFLVAFFGRPEAGALALQAVVSALEPDDGADARKRVGHDREDGPVAQALDIGLDPHPPAVFPRNLYFPGQRNRVEQFSHLVGLEDRGDADLAAELRALNEEGRARNATKKVGYASTGCPKMRQWKAAPIAGATRRKRDYARAIHWAAFLRDSNFWKKGFLRTD